jgi:hypothetical protein
MSAIEVDIPASFSMIIQGEYEEKMRSITNFLNNNGMKASEGLIFRALILYTELAPEFVGMIRKQQSKERLVRNNLRKIAFASKGENASATPAENPPTFSMILKPALRMKLAKMQAYLLSHGIKVSEGLIFRALLMMIELGPELLGIIRRRKDVELKERNQLRNSAFAARRVKPGIQSS